MTSPAPPTPERWRELLTRLGLADHDLDGTQLAEAIWLAAQWSTHAEAQASETTDEPVAAAGPEPTEPSATPAAPKVVPPAPAPPRVSRRHPGGLRPGDQLRGAGLLARAQPPVPSVSSMVDLPGAASVS